MRSLCHGVCLQHWGPERLLKFVERFGRKGTGTRSDKADFGHWARKGTLQQNLVNGRDGGIPVCLVLIEVFPELGGGELGRHND